ncbi:MAG: CAF17-like 4Fe-4S cluster assembly/insertion protein YgfZ [Ehrlichia sp.]
MGANGRYLYDFFVIQYEKCILLDCYSVDKGEIIEKFLLYKLQSKVVIKEKKHYKVGVFIGEDYSRYRCGYTYCKNGSIFFQDPRLPKLGLRVIFNESDKILNGIHSDLGEYEDYEVLRISNGVPDCSKDMVKGVSFPLHFRMDELNAVDFNKGCYIGQEVVARMYRAGIKKSVYTIISEHGFFPDVKITHAGQEVGILLSSIRNLGLCLLDVSLVSNLCDLEIGNTKVKILR